MSQLATEKPSSGPKSRLSRFTWGASEGKHSPANRCGLQPAGSKMGVPDRVYDGGGDGGVTHSDDLHAGQAGKGSVGS